MVDYFNKISIAYDELEEEMKKAEPDKFKLESLLVNLEQETSNMLHRVATKMEWNVKKEEPVDSKVQN